MLLPIDPAAPNIADAAPTAVVAAVGYAPGKALMAFVLLLASALGNGLASESPASLPEIPDCGLKARGDSSVPDV